MLENLSLVTSPIPKVEIQDIFLMSTLFSLRPLQNLDLVGEMTITFLSFSLILCLREGKVLWERLFEGGAGLECEHRLSESHIVYSYFPTEKYYL